MGLEMVAAFGRRHLSKVRPMFETRGFLTSNSARTTVRTRKAGWWRADTAPTLRVHQHSKENTP
jgi:hypothetical protein